MQVFFFSMSLNVRRFKGKNSIKNSKEVKKSPCMANPSLAHQEFKVQTEDFLQVSSSAATRLSILPSFPSLVHFSYYLDQNYCSHTHTSTKTDAKSSTDQSGCAAITYICWSSLNRSWSFVELHAQRVSLIDSLISLLTSSLLMASNPG